jgi:hypothetical protein
LHHLYIRLILNFKELQELKEKINTLIETASVQAKEQEVKLTEVTNMYTEKLNMCINELLSYRIEFQYERDIAIEEMKNKSNDSNQPSEPSDSSASSVELENKNKIIVELNETIVELKEINVSLETSLKALSSSDGDVDPLDILRKEMEKRMSKLVKEKDRLKSDLKSRGTVLNV